MENNPNSSSVIIPTYNRVHTLERCIKSVLGQSQLPDEIIIVDDGSTDSTKDLLSRIKKTYEDKLKTDKLKTDKSSELKNINLKIIHTENKGVSQARNLGVEASLGNWIFFLDSDDEWLSSKLETQIGFHKKNPTYLISQTQEKWIRYGAFVNKQNKHKKASGWIFEHSLDLCSITASSVCIQRTLWDTVCGFDTDLKACEDYDLWLAITDKYEVALIDEECLVRYGGEPDQLSAKYNAMDRFRIYALLKRKTSLQDNHLELVYSTLVRKLKILIEGRNKRNKDSTILTEILSSIELEYHSVKPKQTNDERIAGEEKRVKEKKFLPKIPNHWKDFLLNDENWE